GNAALEERQFVVKFYSIDMEGALRGANPSQRLLRKQALIGQIMDGQDAWNPDSAPGEVSRRECGLPIIDVNEVCCPISVQHAGCETGSRRGKSPETQIVVGPIPARHVAIGIAGTVIELRAQQHIDRQAVPGRSSS